MKSIKTTIKNALAKKLLKIGDEFIIRGKITSIDDEDNTVRIMFSENCANWVNQNVKIVITKPKPVPIDFTAEGRILQFEDIIIRTAGLQRDIDNFSGYALCHPTHGKGYTTNCWDTRLNWQDITELYSQL